MAFMVPFKSSGQIAQEETIRAEAIKMAEDASRSAFLSTLAGNIRGKWETAKRHRISTGIERRMVESKRARKGEYPPDKLAAMANMFGQDYVPVFMMLTDVQCRIIESNLKESFMKDDDPPWDIQPSPKPAIPEEIMREIRVKAFERVILDQLKKVYNPQPMMPTMAPGVPGTMPMGPAMGMQPPMMMVTPPVMKSASELAEEADTLLDKEIKRRAKLSAEKIKVLIKDQLSEGGFKKAFKDIIHDIATYHTCFIKGPVLKREKNRRKITIDPITREWTVMKDEDNIIPKWERRPPSRIYPSPGGTTIENCLYLVDLVTLTPSDLSDMLGTENTNDEAIKRVLDRYRNGGLREWTSIDPELSKLENNTMGFIEKETIDTVEFYGSVSGKMLTEWAYGDQSFFGEPIDPYKEYEITCWLIDNEVIRCILNSERNIQKASFVDDPDSFWGILSPPEIIAGPQSVCNAIARSIVNNVGIGSGPLVEWDNDRVSEGEPAKLWPWRVIKSTNQMMNQGPAVKFYTPPMIAKQLMEVFERMSKKAEDYLNPGYATGDPQVGGAGNTASGLSMLMSAANRQRRSVDINIDDGIICETIKKIYNYNLDLNLVRPFGDMTIIARGSTSAIIKEQQAVRRTEFMRETNNPLDSAIIGMEGRKYLLEETAKAIEIDTERLFAEASIEGIEYGGAEMLAGRLPGSNIPTNSPGMFEVRGSQPSAQTMDKGGNKSRGKDYMTFGA